jgi:1-acyl-sn-glycerol-3-phosphate acyltransferase
VGARFPKLAKVTVRFGKPIDVTRFNGIPAGRARRDLTDQVMDSIAAHTRQDRADDNNEVPGADNGP